MTQQSKQAYWQKKTKAWEGSGLTQQMFCKNEKLNLTTFRYWRSKSIPKTKPLFIKAVRQTIASEGMQIVFAAGIRISIPEAMPLQTVSQVMEAVNGILCVSTGKR
jgi:hypothetical protein